MFPFDDVIMWGVEYIDMDDFAFPDNNGSNVHGLTVTFYSPSLSGPAISCLAA